MGTDSIERNTPALTGFRRGIRHAALAILDATLPEPCALCGRPILSERDSGAPICRSCTASLPTPETPRCRICSASLISEHEICTRCRDRDFAFRRNISLYAYRGYAKRLVRRYKFDGVHALAGCIACGVAKLIESACPGAPIVPVPPRPRRRGFRWPGRRVDQVERIVRILASRHHIEVRRLLLRDAGAAQKNLGYEERLGNLTGKFRCPEMSAPPPDRVVLFDDVFTTGATASECARVLTEHGVREVDVVTVAID